MGNDLFNQRWAFKYKAGIDLHQRRTGRYFLPGGDNGVDSADADNWQLTLQLLGKKANNFGAFQLQWPAA